MSYLALLTDTVTYWAPATPDGYGGMTFATPVQIVARYQNCVTNEQDGNGEEFVSSAIVYTNIALAQNGWIMKGTSAQADPQSEALAYRVRKLCTSDNPEHIITIRKAILG